jgi:uncharacterized protein
VSWPLVAEAFGAALAIACVTAPVGVSGAVFLLPVELNVLHVANPSVTPTNLLYNVIAGPGALLRYRRSGRLWGPLTRRLLMGTVPGVVIGAVVRVYVVPGPQAFRWVVAAVLLPLGVWLIARTLRSDDRPRRGLPPRSIAPLALAVGVVGGIYGIGGGSILGPLLVGSGLTVTEVAPAALTSTFVTSVVGALTYALLAVKSDGTVAPDWVIGLSCGLGGLCGGYAGTRLQPFVPDRGLRLVLGGCAVTLSAVYAVQAVTQ